MLSQILLFVLTAQVVFGDLVCEEGQNYLRLLMHCRNWCNEQVVTIYSGAEAVYHSPIYVSSVDSDTEVCLPASTNNQYTMNFTDTNSDAWMSGSYLTLYGKYGNIFFKYYQTNLVSEEHPLSLQYAINMNEVWKITNSISGQWTEYSFEDTLWPTETLGSVVNSYPGAQYFRKTFSGMENMASYEVRMNYRFGVIAYVNGEEVYRDNMPSGPVSSDTECSDSYSTLDMRGFLRSGREVRSSSSILAVELHFPDASQTTVDFDAFLALLTPSVLDAPCVLYPYPVTITSSVLGLTASNIFDFNPGTSISMRDSSISTFWFDIEVNSTVIPQVNGIRYESKTSTYNFRRSVFAGMEDDVEHTILTVGDVEMASDEKYNFFSYFNTQVYKQFRLTILDRYNDLCQIHEYMPAICSFDPPATLEFRGHDFVSFVNLEAINVVPVSLDFSNCTLSPELPAGLVFDPSHCSISGVATVTLPNTTFVMTSNALSTPVSGSFSITVNDCTGVIVQLLRIYKSDAAREGFAIYDADTESEIYSVPLNSNQRNNEVWSTLVCLTSSRIRINLLSDQDAWSSDSYLYINAVLDEEAKETLLRVRFDNNLGLSPTYFFNINFPIKNSEEWHYYRNGDVPTDWYLSDTSGWLTGSKGNFESFTNRVQLYKKSFSIDSLTDIPGFMISIQYQFGCAIYVNGVEVFMNGITEVSPTAVVTHNYTAPGFHTVTLPVKTMSIDGEESVSYLQTGQNTIAVALVADSDASTASTFDGLLVLLGSDEFDHAFNYTITSREGQINSSGDPLEHGYNDGFYSSNCGSNSAVVTFDNDRRVWVSSILIQSYYRSQEQFVKSFSVLAKNQEDAEWTELAAFDNLPWSLKGQTKKMWLKNNKPYNQYMFVNFTAVTDCSWRVNRIDLYSDNLAADIPALAYESSSAYLNIEISEVYPNSRMYQEFSSDPALPTGLVICPATGVISGTARVIEAERDYTISAKKATGEAATAVFHLGVVVCTGGKGLITARVRVDNYPAETSYKLLEGRGDSGDIIVDVPTPPIQNGLAYVDRCLDDGLYTFIAVDSYGDGWSSPGGYMLTVDMGEMIFETRMVPRGTAPVQISSTFSSYIPFQTEYSDWQVLKAMIAVNGWTAVDFDDSAWDTVKAADIGVSSYVTTFIRKTFSIPNLEDYQVLNIRARYSGGLIVYFNGNRVGRFNMQEDFDELTFAIIERDSSLFSKFHIVLGLNGATVDKNVLAFEVHRSSEESLDTPVVFDATGVFGVEVCSMVVDSYTDISGSSSTVDFSASFDYNVETYSQLDFQPSSHILWRVENYEGSIFNSYGILSSSSVSGLRFSLRGSKDAGVELMELSSVAAASITERSVMTYDSPANFMPFVYFEWLVETEVSMRIQSFLFYYCKGTGAVCPADGEYPSVAEGQLSPAMCDEGYNGFKYRECDGESLGEVKTDRCVYKIPVNLMYDSAVLELVKDTRVQRVPTYDYIITRFYTDRDLPAGLTLNEQTGAIEGIPTEVSELSTYIITGENSVGAAQTEVLLTVREGHCTLDGYFQTTNVGEEFVFDCTSIGSYVGTQRRRCELGTTDGEWQEITGFCVSIVTIVVLIVVAIIIIVIIILILVRMSKKRKPTKGTRGAKNLKVEKAKIWIVC